eukprot:CAMPEP_0114131772 /NCGR_PEP_ID=MMETSP0043_2-20121206/12732_1 /TAXON_ID=464988 /ORGANISM="Hemiselmis andersenii, Strain CCMP644" /LENGTH=89 /DNA_ID=CAMNT_0001225227 /DNA_START=410 /DNA_END=676 /DNA_ORIENTATION=-
MAEDVVRVGGATGRVCVAIPVHDVGGTKGQASPVTVVVVPAIPVAELPGDIEVTGGDEGGRVEGELLELLDVGNMMDTLGARCQEYDKG